VIRVGQVTAPYGLDGAVKVFPLTDFADRFEAGACLLLAGAQRQVEWSRASQPGLVVKLQGIDNRTMAELVRGQYLELPDDQVRSLEAGSFYHYQVVGLAAVTQSGERLGVITEVLERPANDVWVIHEGSVEHLIPATKEAVLEVDLGQGKVVIADWLTKVDDVRD
jgi:16S rRNA processing protein RimM